MQGRRTLSEVYLDADRAKSVAVFLEPESFERHLQITPMMMKVNKFVDVTLERVDLSGPADLLPKGEFGPLITDLRPLTTRPDILERIGREYGFLPIDYAVEARGARRRGLPLHDPAPEGPVAALINLALGRAVLWLLAPTASVLAFWRDGSICWGIAALTLALGAAAQVLSWPVYRPPPEPG